MILLEMIVWCCCSAGRPDMLVSKTLATLARGNFQGSLYVVVPSEQLVAYQRAVMGNPVHCILMHCEKGLTKQRRFFRESWPAHVPIMWLDDDIEAIKVLTPTGLIHCRNVDALATLMVGTLLATETGLLIGVYPVANRGWMKNTVTQNNAYCAGAMYATINDPKLLEFEHDECEDYYRQLSEQAAGRPVLRINWIGIQTQYWKNAGGLQENRTDDHRAAIVDRLCAEFSTVIKKRVRRNGKPDFKFLEKPVVWEPPQEDATIRGASEFVIHSSDQSDTPPQSQPETADPDGLPGLSPL